MNIARGYARMRFCGRRCEGTPRVNCYRLSLNKTVGQARRLPIHRMASGSACPTNPLLEVSYRFSVIRQSLPAVVGRIRPLADLLPVIFTMEIGVNDLDQAWCRGNLRCHNGMHSQL